MNISFKKASAVGLCACLALTSLAGCSKKEEEFDAAAAAVTVNGTEIPAGVVSFATHYSQSLMESFYASYTGTQDPFNTDLYGNGTTLGSLLKDDVVSELTEMVLAEQKMGDYSVELTEEEKSAITAAVTAFIEDNDEEVLKEMSADQETVERYLELTTIKNKMEEAMTADVDTEVSDEEAAQRRVQYTMFTPSTETETEAETDTENGTEAESDTDTENGAEADTENGSEAETTLETEGETAPETEGETAALTEEETVKTQAAAETESETAVTGTEEVTEKAEEASADGAAIETETEESGDTEAQDTEVSDTEALSEAETETETETEDPAMVEARAKAKAQAQEMLDNIKGGMDFAEAAEAAGKAANEMTFGVGDEETRAELLAATDGLEDGTLVENVVETENGYYVVKLISQLDREATDAEKESIVAQRKNDRIEELYTEWKDAGEISQNDEVMATITFDFALSQYVEPTTEGATEAAAETELETDAETESETNAETESGTDDESESGTEAPAEEAAAEASTEAVTE